MGRKSISGIRKQQIVEAFYEVARKEGLENASIAKIAKLMDIHPSLIIHYFKTKEDMILELIAYNLEQYGKLYEPAFKEMEDPYQALLHLLDHLFSSEWNTLFDDSVFYSCYALTYRYPEIRSKYRNLHDSLHLWLADIIRQCQKEGSLAPGDPENLARLVFVIIDGAYYYLGMMEDKIAYKERMEQYKEGALRLLSIGVNS